MVIHIHDSYTSLEYASESFIVRETCNTLKRVPDHPSKIQPLDLGYI